MPASHAPVGQNLGATGAPTWKMAVEGSYALKVTVKDSHGLAGAVATVMRRVTG